MRRIAWRTPSRVAVQKTRLRSSPNSSTCSAAMENKMAVRDPVCGMTVNTATAEHRAEHAGESYFFCSAGCLSKFMAEPGKYVGAAPIESMSGDSDAIYTCPMHPQVRQKGPGN